MGCGSSSNDKDPKQSEPNDAKPGDEPVVPDGVNITNELAGVNITDDNDMELDSPKPETPRDPFSPGRYPIRDQIRSPHQYNTNTAEIEPIKKPDPVKITYHMTAQGIIPTIETEPVITMPYVPEQPRLIPTIFSGIPALQGDHPKMTAEGTVPLSFFQSSYNTQSWLLKDANARRTLGIDN